MADKITKNHRKTLGLMRDIADVATYGVIRDDAQTGITEMARPIGVIGAVVPTIISHQPSAISHQPSAARDG